MGRGAGYSPFLFEMYYVVLLCCDQLRPVLKHTNMKSRITIEVNFDENNLPVIQILSQNSDDVRDKLIQSFLQSLQHTSRWCKILYIGNFGVADMIKNNPVAEVHKWHIVPITPKEITEEIKLMQATLKRLEKVS